MAIIKNEIPILEYDNSQSAVIMPNHEQLDVKLPEKCVFGFLREHLEDYALSCNAEAVAYFDTINRITPVYIAQYHGEQICFCAAPLGSAAAAQFLDWLISYGVRKVIATGCCGALIDLPENAFFIPTKALRDEGASYHYLPPARYVELNKAVIASMKETLDFLQIPYAECVTWTTDGFYRETKELVEYRKSEGCCLVEMECAALAACSAFRGVSFGQLLFTADSLADTDAWDARSWGKDAFEKALEICLEIVSRL